MGGGHPKTQGIPKTTYQNGAAQSLVAYCSRCNGQHPPGLHTRLRVRALASEENHGYEGGSSPPPQAAP